MDEGYAHTYHRGFIDTVLTPSSEFGHDGLRSRTYRPDKDTILRQDGLQDNIVTIGNGIVQTVVGTAGIISLREVIVRWCDAISSISLNVIIVLVLVLVLVIVLLVATQN